MPYQVTIQPSGHQFNVNTGETLLQAALHAGFGLPYGCRNGACGACKGKVLSGEVDLGNYQTSALSPEEQAQGLALFCCAMAKSDLGIEVKEVGATLDIPVKTLPCRVERMERLADDVMALWLKLPANERLQFLPGQYIDFLLKDGQRRSFSLANSPDDDGPLELHVRHVKGGKFTDQVFTTMKPRDILRINGPHGSFFLRESDKPVLLVAGGTGFAPIKSIMAHALHHQDPREFVFYWGVRTQADLYLPDLPAQWQQAHANFSFIPVLDQPVDHWPGRVGRVHEAVLADFSDLSGYEVYVCGAPPMVQAARRDFQGRGLPLDAFYSDSFDYQAAQA